MKFGSCCSFPDSGEAGEGHEPAAATHQASWCISSVYCSYSSKLKVRVCMLSLLSLFPPLRSLSPFLTAMHAVILQCFFLSCTCLCNNSKWCLAPGGDAEEHQAYEMYLLTCVACFRVSFCLCMVTITIILCCLLLCQFLRMHGYN